MKKKEIEHVCKNCLLYDHPNRQCKVAVIINGQKLYMPVSPKDKCHMEEMGIEVEQVRWFIEDSNSSDKGKVKVEYPEKFFETGKTIEGVIINTELGEIQTES